MPGRLPPVSDRSTTSRVEQRDQRVEVAAAGRLEERVDDLALPGEVGIGSRDLRALDPAPGPAGQLASRSRRAVDHRRDLLERQLEHVVEHKRETLGRCQRVEHDEQREADRVRQQRLILRRADLWVRQVGAELLLAPGTAGAQDVEADAGDDGGEPGAEVLNVAPRPTG